MAFSKSDLDREVPDGLISPSEPTIFRRRMNLSEQPPVPLIIFFIFGVQKVGVGRGNQRLADMAPRTWCSPACRAEDRPSRRTGALQSHGIQ
jgi:hypothetical protein